MNSKALLFHINTVLGTEHDNIDQVSLAELERAILLVRLNQALDKKLDALPDVAPRVVQRFVELRDGDRFSLPDFATGFEPLYIKNTRLRCADGAYIICPGWTCGRPQPNAQSMQGDLHKRHFCPEDAVLLVKNDTAVFERLDDGALFKIAPSEQVWEKIARPSLAVSGVACDLCDDFVINATRHSGAMVAGMHVCPHVAVREVSF